MNARWIIAALCSTPLLLFAGNLPLISLHPQSQVVAPGSDAILSLESTNATAYQWRFDGADIPWGTNANLIVTNAQVTNRGYYMGVAKNETGWTPSQLAYLSVVGNSVGFVPFANTNNPYAYGQAHYGWMCESYNFAPITNATAQLVAGPVLDWMQPVGSPVLVTNGYYFSSGRSVPTVSPGQLIYYRVDITYTCPEWTYPITQPSTTLLIIAGGEGYSTPSVDALGFPNYIEWPAVVWIDPPFEQTKVPSEAASILVSVYPLSHYPFVQWRKDGQQITGATNRSLTIPNLTPSDSGVYDALVQGVSSAVSHKVYLSVQAQNGEGVFRFPRTTGSDFVADFEGAAGRNYAIHWSTNLTDWSNLLTLTNTTGTTVFSNTISGNTRRYYRAMLLP